MFWYYIRDNYKTLIVGLLIGIIAVIALTSYIFKDVTNKNQQLEPIKEEVSTESTSGGSVYDKYIENSEQIKKEQVQNQDIDYNSKPVANSLNNVIKNLDEFMISRSKELKKESVVMKSNGTELYELLNDGNYEDMVNSLSQYVSEGNVKTILQLYGYGIKNGKVAHQEGENLNSYTVNTQYPIDVTYASEATAEVTVPLTRNGTSDIVLNNESNNLSSTEQIGVVYEEPDYSTMKTAIFSFKKQHGRWIVYNITLN